MSEIIVKTQSLNATYQGGKYLNEQLESISRQSHTNWKLVVSDDGSTDATWDLLKQHQSQWPKGKVELRKGPGRGFCRNFLSIACDPGLSAKYYAFSDQDDIWNNDKLSRATSFLDTVEKGKPALYCSRHRPSTKLAIYCGCHHILKGRQVFGMLLCKILVGVIPWCSMRQLLQAWANLDVPSHDWWLYILVTGCGGQVYYDPVPSILYRQHSSNLVGSNVTVYGRCHGIRLLRGQLSEWNEVHIKSLHEVNFLMLGESKKVFEALRIIREKNTIMRLYYFVKSGIYRQTVYGQIALVLAVLLGKV